MNARSTAADFTVLGKVYPTYNAPLSALPLQFVYGGKEYRGMPEGTRISHEFTDANIFRASYTAIIGGTLEVCLTYREYRDYPVREWIATFTNIGSADTDILENATLGGALPGTVRDFEWSNGDNVMPESYEWFVEKFEDKNEFSIAPTSGTSCCGASPYMMLHMSDYSVRIGIGWPATWQASVTKQDDGSAVYTVGQKRCHMLLHPGETMRTPQLSALVYTGDECRGRNLWRRWYINHILPREDGRPIPPVVCYHNHNSEGKPEFTAATEENQITAMKRYQDHGIKPDVWWIDAGWYPCNYDWYYVGQWEPDPERFPNGLGPIGEKCEEYGMRFLLWFEPERSRLGSWMEENHREWLLFGPDEKNVSSMFNMGNPEAWKWMVEHVDALIKESHVKVYRQDFNYSRGSKWPENIWIKAESDDRIGAVENLHIQGYLAYWDELLLRNPGLWIDSCAGGGRRNDLDTMRRAVTLQYTDITFGNHPVKQKHYRTMFEWVPYFRSHNRSNDELDGTYTNIERPVDEFAFQTAMTPALTSMTHYQSDDAAFAIDRKMVPLWREAADLMLRGDYYPLTECRKDASDWYAMQFDDSDKNDGFVQVIRNVLVTDDTYILRMHTEAGKTYTFTDRLSGTSFEKTAEELAAGLPLTLEPRSGLVLFYTYK